jgi:uncharacterized membrane protein
MSAMNFAATNAAAPVAAATAPASARPRVQSVDILRGLVMIVMALDHVRDFLHYGAQHFDPADLSQTTPILFFTRWITHFCAPTFMFLAGTGAYLQSRRGKSMSVVAHFLWTRGLWLVVLELTWVRWFGWRMNFGNDQIFLWVIWALGMSMIALAGLVFVPWKVLLGGSLAVIVLHNALDGVTPAQFGPLSWLWTILHVPGPIAVSPQVTLLPFYPLIPWIFVMAAGYCFGRVMDLEPERRRSVLLKLGGTLIAAFVILRWSNWYGDARRWSSESTPLLTLASFLNCTKYPPSLLYLLMTLGPGILILGLLERVRLPDANPLIVFGRVPLFFYLLHLPLIHGTAILLGWFRYGRIDFLLHNPPAIFGPASIFPPDYGYDLGVVYLVWIGVVVALYPVCRWFAAVKQRNRSAILSYF